MAARKTCSALQPERIEGQCCVARRRPGSVSRPPASPCLGRYIGIKQSPVPWGVVCAQSWECGSACAPCAPCGPAWPSWSSGTSGTSGTPSARPAAWKEKTGLQTDEVVTAGCLQTRLIVNRCRAASSTALNSPCAPRAPLLTWPSSRADGRELETGSQHRREKKAASSRREHVPTR